MARLLDLALYAFELRKFDQCRKLCRSMQIIDPGYYGAADLERDVELAARYPDHADRIRPKHDVWRAAGVPFVGSLTFPSRDEWHDLRSRETSWSSREERAAFARDIETARITLDVPSADLDVALQLIRETAVINLVIDDGVTLRELDPICLRVFESPLPYVLDDVARHFGLRWCVEDGVVVFRRR